VSTRSHAAPYGDRCAHGPRFTQPSPRRRRRRLAQTSAIVTAAIPLALLLPPEHARRSRRVA
jgi:hypothetical protein